MITKDILALGKLSLIELLVILLVCPSLRAQRLDVAYVPTPHKIVEKMLDIADVGRGDYVIDLGSGDGRIVIGAAKRGAFGHGVELDPQCVKAAEINAIKAGVADKVLFLEESIYETDFSMANIIMMYLFPTINIKLRPLLLEKLEPGAKIVSHDFGMDEWKPDKFIKIGDHSVFLWIIPAGIGGTWMWKAGGEIFIMNAEQHFQKIVLNIKSGNVALPADNIFFSGKRISFSAFNPLNMKQYLYNGIVEGNNIKGFIQLRNDKSRSVEVWNAVLE